MCEHDPEAASFTTGGNRIAAKSASDLRCNSRAAVEHVDLQLLSRPARVNRHLRRTGVGGVVEQVQERLLERRVGGDARTRTLSAKIDARRDRRSLQTPALDELRDPVFERGRLCRLRTWVACACGELRDDA